MQLFEQYYQANFSSSLKSTRDVWYDFVKDCDESILKNAMDTLEEVYVAKKGGGHRVDSPTLGEVKREYWSLKTKGGSSNKLKFCDDNCLECDGTGSVLVVIHMATQKPLDPQNPQAYYYGELAYTNMGCPRAYSSKKHDHRGFGASHTMPLQLAHDYMMKCDALKKREVEA